MPKWKARLLPAVAYNGTFKELNNTGLIDYSSVTAWDFDHIATSDDMVCLRNRLVITPCVLSVFVTPSGRGLKALVWHDNTDSNKHGDLYEQLLTKFYVANKKDTGCKDLARRNYLSYDPYIWVNSNPVPFHAFAAFGAACRHVLNSRKTRKNFQRGKYEFAECLLIKSIH